MLFRAVSIFPGSAFCAVHRVLTPLAAAYKAVWRFLQAKKACSWASEREHRCIIVECFQS